MFERFTKPARAVVTEAQEEARTLGHGHIGTEHILLGLLDQPDALAGRVLIRLGLTREQAVETIVANAGTDELDADALGTLGIDLGAVREKVEAAFGAGALDSPERSGRGRLGGHIPFGRRAKKVLALALREALALKHDYIGTEHILLGLLREGDGMAAKVLHDRGLDPAEVRREVIAALTTP